ncbi:MULTISPECIES: DUF2845 domain-containing protein [unclassified Pseudomonas]|jgi:hypothetical protein|uniref:DUF2845 domain-containing protein n=1 Tax=unclassified Pseudomonas TaxID=196821 RepID=UPI00119C2DF5|nr:MULTISPECIES: DUF2845 domain-containing protein [unclassified Pseudomonas]TWC10656.1 uncharacterized protein DUF2845 [Pseudomonas sp. SJZ075]TWC10874.1 uncharacterized protein DUF2845 [Pseudomonas sp. SJZ074]TWC29012.1 uncharacterized protein DUF2845 [Pseudomonas sp. SJZ085]TWC29072.1 uncharacterized protein DUF2845 [Pseudomonas sp. SJZ078]TWC46209.1 uncharacterized protein DUF2845 [Pseudomonas sp. SJZ124]
MKRLYWLGLGLLLITPYASAADTLRCGSQLISVGDRSSEVLQKCGQPVARDDLGYKRSVNRREEYPVEEWTYGPNSGMYQFLRFEGNRLVQITSRRGH